MSETETRTGSNQGTVACGTSGATPPTTIVRGSKTTHVPLQSRQAIPRRPRRALPRTPMPMRNLHLHTLRRTERPRAPVRRLVGRVRQRPSVQPSLGMLVKKGGRREIHFDGALTSTKVEDLQISDCSLENFNRVARITDHLIATSTKQASHETVLAVMVNSEVSWLTFMIRKIRVALLADTTFMILRLQQRNVVGVRHHVIFTKRVPTSLRRIMRFLPMRVSTILTMGLQTGTLPGMKRKAQSIL